ncbi:hypothetical protein S245_069683, partial [Arachis hypogaea]
DNQECKIEGLEHDTIALGSGFLMHQLNPMKSPSYFRFHVGKIGGARWKSMSNTMSKAN